MAGAGADDDVVEVSCGGDGRDPGAYAAVLKRRLDLYCAAVAKSMSYTVSDMPGATLEIPIAYGNLLTYDDGDGATLVTNSNIIDHEDFRGNPANSGTSKEQSDDDGNLEENTDPANTKKMRRNLTVDVETMRRKVNIAEEAVRRLTGTTLLLSTTCDKTASSMRLTSCPSDAGSASVAIEDSMEHFLQAPLQSDLIKLDLPNAAILLTSGEMGTKPDSLQRVASLEDLQKRIHRDSIHSEIASTFSDPEALANG
ncbi:light-inducible protein CPRF2-like isoform X2 [Panicum miliaceum]|uniref:Light-inducible protein CPRF2-like isoform X2 n=1 Tax=Panicum miliaceum TaxID=4540 RepID=A0A3L6R6Z0_PANMI|nr:light-inducible protein CPRF2-like isoform X2 [Panicum miliaceum]